MLVMECKIISVSVLFFVIVLLNIHQVLIPSKNYHVLIQYKILVPGYPENKSEFLFSVIEMTYINVLIINKKSILILFLCIFKNYFIKRKFIKCKCKNDFDLNVAVSTQRLICLIEFHISCSHFNAGYGM
jgi:hypothetical protein